jgi:carbamoyl-phosphate synthase large subunit
MTYYLITGIGGDIAQGISRIIRAYDQRSILIGTDISERHAGSLFVNHFKVIPSASEVNSYLDHLQSLVAEFDINYLIPTSETEIEAISNHIDLFKDIHVIYPGTKVVAKCLDKYITNKFLSSLGLPVPWTITAQENVPVNYPCIFKGRKGAGSKVLFTVKSADEALFLVKRYPDGIFQELLLPHDNEITCGVFRSKNNKISVLQFQRVLNEGTTSWAKTVYHQDIEDMCKFVAENLDLKGSMNVQLRLTDSGPRIFEINPRFSSTVYMRHLIGFDDVVWSIRDAKGVGFDFSNISPGIECVRTQKSELLPLKSVCDS